MVDLNSMNLNVQVVSSFFFFFFFLGGGGGGGGSLFLFLVHKSKTSS